MKRPHNLQGQDSIRKSCPCFYKEKNSCHSDTGTSAARISMILRLLSVQNDPADLIRSLSDKIGFCALDLFSAPVSV